jgi:hypothetical protein
LRDALRLDIFIEILQAGTRARVEARAALEQVEELRRVLGDLRKRFGRG